MSYASSQQLAAEVAARKNADQTEASSRTVAVNSLDARLDAVEAWIKAHDTPVPPVDPPTGTWAPLQEPHTPGPPPNPSFTTIQAAVDAAAAGAVITVPPGTYRERVTINQPVTLLGYGVTVVGDMAKDEEWFRVFASDVTLEGFRCHTSGRATGGGGIQLAGYSHASDKFDHLTLRNLWLTGTLDGSVSTCDVVNFQGKGGANHLVEGCIIENGGRAGMTLSGQQGFPVTFPDIRRTVFRGNSRGLRPAGPFDEGNDASALKVLDCHSPTLSAVEFADNLSRGYWSDSRTTNAFLENVYAHGNGFNGIFFEAADGAEVTGYRGEGNTLNPRNVTDFAGDIALNSCRNVEVDAANIKGSGGGVSVTVQVRTDAPPHTGVYIHGGSIEVDPAKYAVRQSGNRTDEYFLPASNNVVTPNVVSGIVG